MSYTIIFLIVLFAGFAMTVREGLWSNAITLINIIVSGLVAFGFYSALTVYLNEEQSNGQHTYWLDFAVLWAIFCAMMVICRTLTTTFSKTRMRFKHPIDPYGGPLVGFIAAWVLASFTMATMHTAPMGREFLGGKLVYDVELASPFSQPDVVWLKFFESMSQPAALGISSTDRFSASGFVRIYSDRRAKFDKAPSLIVPRTVTHPPQG